MSIRTANDTTTITATQEKEQNDNNGSMFRIKSTWSKAGVGTCIVLETSSSKSKTTKTKIVFDLGATPIFDDTISSSIVILSHGHVDHVGAIFNHARAHSVVYGGGSNSVPTYYVPEQLRPKVEQMRQVMSDLDATCIVNDDDDIDQRDCHRNESLMKMNIIGVKAGDEIELKQRKSCGARLFLHPFHVNHGGHPALGYSIQSKTPGGLKDEYKGLPSHEIRNLVQSGIQIKKEDVVKVEVTYTGDTCAAGIMNPASSPSLSSSLKKCDADSKQQQQQRSELYLRQAFTAPLIFCELTFLDVDNNSSSNTDLSDCDTDKKKKKKKNPVVLDQKFAMERGHMHIQDIVPVFLSHGWNIFESAESDGCSGVGEDLNDDYDNDVMAMAKLSLSSAVLPMHSSNSNNDKKKIVFLHISGRHAPATRALDQIVQSGLIPPKLLECCSVAVSSFVTRKDDGADESNIPENDSWLSLVEDDGCISLLEYVKYLEKR